ncbi:cytochrome P450 [Pluteus cervinus]|uniref:Cytochrome P450 n=1 Tax=Pluteus cervinus TaxID=181527 RepID=A0ACD3AYU5_9AGAR|nr:cytochrome P450 [Pluteus cervinus]
MFEFSSTTWTLIGLFLAYLVKKYINAAFSPIHKIPTVGPSGVITSYWGGLKALKYAKDMIQEGYEKYYGRPFKIPMMSRWVVVVSGPQLIDDVRKASEDDLSFNEAMNEAISFSSFNPPVQVLQVKYILGPELHDDLYHVVAVRNPLTRNLPARFSELQDEIAAAFSEYVPATDDEWSSVPAYSTIVEVVCRATNRIFVGLPLCRDPEYRKLNINFTVDAFKAGVLLSQFPKIFRPIAARLFTNMHAKILHAMDLLGPMLEERFVRDEKFGLEDPERPSDLVSWMLDYAKPQYRTVRDFTMRILVLNFAAIHTTTAALTNALYDLAVHPEYIEPMREEILSVIASEGWTKVGINKLRKVDSFLRESQRLVSGALSVTRRAMKDFTFSDGTVVPKGSYVFAASRATHLDKVNYPNPHEFQGFRFSDMREDEGEEESSKHQTAYLGLDWVIFGGGKHPCPGRFFAVDELKAMLAYILLNYDVKLAEGEGPPEPMWFGANRIPNRKAHVLFRKRNLL